MLDNLRVLALIPARGGSKGIPGKNIKLLGGKPVIAYSIEAALNSVYIDDVVISTDDEDIAQVARDYGANIPFMRPIHLATDQSQTLDAVLHAITTLENMGQSYDVLVLLQPTSPQRTTKHIDEALELFYRTGQNTVGIQPVPVSPILMRTRSNDGLLSPLLQQSSTVRRQDMPAYYVVNGAIYINKIAELSPTTSFNDNPMGYLMEPLIDLDTPEDYQTLNQIFSMHV